MKRDTSAPELLAFDTELLPPNERLDRYRAIYDIGAEVTATGPAPSVWFQGWRLDRAILYDRRINDIGHVRTNAKLDGYGLTHWTITVVLDGWIAFDLGDGPRQVRPGELLLIDTNMAGRNDARHAHIATLSIAQDRLEEIIGPLGHLHGTVISVEEGRLYADFVRSLLATLPTLHWGALPAVTSTLGMILRAALDMRSDGGGRSSSTQQTLRLAQFRSLVDARLSDAAFGTEAAIEESGLSRATLYRLLHPQGGLAAFIQYRRLEQIRRHLSDPNQSRSFAEIAGTAGFRDEGQASRAFKARFGIRPTAYRAAMTQADAQEQFRAWQQDLR